MRPIALLLLLVLSSCAITSKKLVGTYTYWPRFEMYADLQLNADSTFVYTNNLGKARIKAQGYWTLGKKSILLNSYNDNRDAPVVFKHDHKKGVTINVKSDDESTPLPGALIRIYHNSQITRIEADRNGCAYIDLPNIDSIVVNNPGFCENSFVPLPNTNYFNVNLSFFKHVVFTNVRWKMNGRRIHLPPNETFEKEYVFKKDQPRPFN